PFRPLPKGKKGIGPLLRAPFPKPGGEGRGRSPSPRLAGRLLGGFLLLLLLGEVLLPKPLPDLVEKLRSLFELIPGIAAGLEWLQAAEIYPNLVGGDLRRPGFLMLRGQVLRGDDLLLRGLGLRNLGFLFLLSHLWFLLPRRGVVFRGGSEVPLPFLSIL